MSGIKNIFLKTNIFWLSVLLCLFISLSEISIDLVFGDGDGKISNTIIHFLFKGLFFVCLIPAIFSIPTTFPGFWKKLLLKFNETVKTEMSAKALGIFRIIFFIISLKLIWSARDVYSISNYNKSPEQLVLISKLFYVEIAALLLIIIGVGGRLPYIFNFIYGSTFLHGDVGTEMFNLVSFWAIFSGLDQSYSVYYNLKNTFLNVILNYRPAPLKWPIILMGIHFSYTITTAGLSKVQDGVWDNNLGFYYTFLQPWLRGNTFDGLLDYKWLMILMNWLTVISEIIALPLLLFKRTRFIGGINLLFMFMLLTFPFRIDAIGPFGIAIACVVMASAKKNGFTHNTNLSVQQPNWTGFFNKAFFLFFICWTTFSIYFETLNTVNSGRLTYPMAANPFERKEITVGSTCPDIFDLPFLNYLNPDKVLAKLNGSVFHKVSPKWYAPFNYWHFVGRVNYSVCIEHNGELFEPIKIFNEDGSMNTTLYSGGFLQERVVQNRMWLLGVTAHKLAAGIKYDSFSLSEKQQLKAFAGFFSREIKKMGYDGDLFIRTRYIRIPEKFEGNVKPWLSEKWYTILKFNNADGSFTPIDTPATYPDMPYSIKDKIILKPA